MFPYSLDTKGPLDQDGKQRALSLLGLPSGTFDFATTVIMSYGLKDVTAFEVWKEFKWPHPRTDDGCKIYHEASTLLGIILAVWYPQGYVARDNVHSYCSIHSGEIEESRTFPMLHA